MRNWENIQIDIAIIENAMKQKLRENEHKGYWGDMTLLKLAKLLETEIEELNDAILTKGPMEIIREAADVANFAMMIASNTFRHSFSKPSNNLFIIQKIEEYLNAKDQD